MGREQGKRWLHKMSLEDQHKYFNLVAIYKCWAHRSRAIRQGEAKNTVDIYLGKHWEGGERVWETIFLR